MVNHEALNPFVRPRTSELPGFRVYSLGIWGLGILGLGFRGLGFRV